MTKIKKVGVVIFALVLVSLAAYAQVKSRMIGPTLGLPNAEKSLGSSKFDESQFKVGTEADRTHMAAALLKNKSKFVGSSIGDVTKRLGKSTGYFWNDKIPAYVLSADSPDGLSWQIVFLPGPGWKVADVVINQNNYVPK